MRFSRAIFLAAISSCAHSPGAPITSAENPNAQAASGALPAPSAASSASAASEAASPTPANSAVVLPEPIAPKVVLHTGDSMVGFYAGLERALSPHFESMGSKYVQDAITSAAIITFDKGDHFPKMIASNNPDLVIITLGANDVFIPNPQRLAKNVASIAKKTAGRRCFWMGPPVWKKDTGIVDVIRDNCAPCTFFDSSPLKLERMADGIHPDSKGAETWASAFWDFYRTQPAVAAVAAPGSPLISSH